MTIEDLSLALQRALAGPLPGAEAHVLLSPQPRPGWRPGRLPGESRPGAALLLFYPSDGEVHFVLTVRAKHLPSHRGQVSLPGGALEEGESFPAAALREAQEEVGVDPAEVQVLGSLTPLHIPASGYVLHPVVGVASRRPELRRAEGEVERILEVPFRDLMDPARLRSEPRRIREEACLVPYFDLSGEKVWGATAMVLAELRSMLAA